MMGACIPYPSGTVVSLESDQLLYYVVPEMAWMKSLIFLLPWLLTTAWNINFLEHFFGLAVFPRRPLDLEDFWFWWQGVRGTDCEKLEADKRLLLVAAEVLPMTWKSDQIFTGKVGKLSSAGTHLKFSR